MDRTKDVPEGSLKSGYPHIVGCAWSLVKWFVGLTVFFVASEILERALGIGHYWTGALILLFVVTGYVAGRMDALTKEQQP